MGAAMTPATSAITEALPAAQQGIGSALNDLSRCAMHIALLTAAGAAILAAVGVMLLLAQPKPARSASPDPAAGSSCARIC